MFCNCRGTQTPPRNRLSGGGRLPCLTTASGPPGAVAFKESIEVAAADSGPAQATFQRAPLSCSSRLTMRGAGPGGSREGLGGVGGWTDGWIAIAWMDVHLPGSLVVAGFDVGKGESLAPRTWLRVGASHFRCCFGLRPP